MTNNEAIFELIDKWQKTRIWAEELICEHLKIECAVDILQREYRGKNQLGDTNWFYRTHGVGVDVSKQGNKGGIDFDFGSEFPDKHRLRGFMIKQLNDGNLTKRYYHELLQNEQLWCEMYALAANKT
jgi:hypothetical protein